MIVPALNRYLPSIWSRLLVSVLAIVAIVWVVLGVAIVFFFQVSRDYSDLAEVHVPRIALASELAENSAKLAAVTTAIVGQQEGGAEAEMRAQLEEAILAITAQIEEADRAMGRAVSDSDTLKDDLGGLLQEVLITLEERRSLSSKIAQRMADLRWLNVDIQDEVDPLLNDFTFNIAVATELLAKSADQSFRSAQGARIVAESTQRDAIQQIGGEAATVVTLILQSAVATDMAQLVQFKNLSEDALARLGDMTGGVPRKAEFLTLRQSVEALGQLTQADDSVFRLRRIWIETQAGLLVLLNDVQQKLSGLQSELAAIGAEQRSAVLAVTSASARRSELAVLWLIGLTVLAGVIGAAVLMGYIRNGIVLPLGKMSAAMLAIADGKPMGELPGVGEDEIGKMSWAVGVFQQSVSARDTAFAQLSSEVTERRRAVVVLKRTQADLVQAGKLAALGQLSSGISHELSQPLAAMKHRVHLLLAARSEGANDKVDRQIDRMSGLITRMEATIKHLKRFARRSEYRSDNLRLADIIGESMLLLKGRIDAPGITLVTSPALNKAVVKGDQILIEQVVVNLLSNALDAIWAAGEEGTINLEGMQQEDSFSLVVSDDGVGLGTLTEEAVFDPFVTTKEVGESLGLGLSISYNIAKDLGGDLRLEANTPKGIRAILTLPVGDAVHEP